MSMIFSRKKSNYRRAEINPDEILLDAYNLPSFDTQQFEGRVEQPIKKRSLQALFGIAIGIAAIFSVRLGYIQLAEGKYFAQKSDQNSLNHIPLFADRGIIYDRNGVELAWNDSTAVDPTSHMQERAYINQGGFASLLGYVMYPTKDSQGNFWQLKTEGKDGIERQYNQILTGTNGVKLVETNVHRDLLSENTIEQPTDGTNVTLSIDAGVQASLYSAIKALAEQSGYRGGGGAIMDVKTGELLAMTSYPEYDPAVLSAGNDTAKIQEYLTSSAKPFLNRVLDGVYTPGSIVKPFLALGALQENIITPEKIIISTGTLEIPNPYNPKLKSIFKDNAVHGPVDMRKAIAVSSNQYFYEVGGGYGDQPGLGIANIEKYSHVFGIGEKTGIDLVGEQEGNIPSVAWKQKVFPGDPWRIGDTYNTAIGQYGFQVTPLQMLRGIAAVAARGTLVTPELIKGAPVKTEPTSVSIADDHYTVVHEAMRMCVTIGTCGAFLNSPVTVAAKTGTAQIKQNTRVNAWTIGFFPYEHPRYAFVALMEDGPKVSVSATHAIAPVLDWMAQNRPELLTPQP